jgi:hypothetical protein
VKNTGYEKLQVKELKLTHPLPHNTYIVIFSFTAYKVSFLSHDEMASDVTRNHMSIALQAMKNNHNCWIRAQITHQIR